MGDRRSDGGWEGNFYSEGQIQSVLLDIGIEIDGETGNDFVCFCPLHGNHNTPSFSVSKEHGKFICFNHSCDESGSLIDLVKRISKKNEFQARRFIIKRKDTVRSLSDSVDNLFSKEPELPTFEEDKIESMHKELLNNDAALEYLYGRGFESDTISEFKLGYSAKRNLIAVPMYAIDGTPVGVIGRPLGRHAFKNSKGLPTSKTLWNVQRAKRGGGKVVIAEASFDAMRISQSGYPAVATLSGHISPYHIQQLDRYFTEITIMTDFDTKQFRPGVCRKCKGICKGHNPGRDLGMTISEKLPRKIIRWAMCDDKTVYPHGAKDACDMNDDEIRHCISNAVSDFEYRRLAIY